MNAVKSIANLAPTLSSVALAAENAKILKKQSKATGDLIKMGITNLAGIPLIRAQSSLVAKL